MGFFLRDNAPAHQSNLVKDLLVKNNVTALELLHYSPDRLQLIFICSLDWNQYWRDGIFCVATDIIKNATEELKRLSQNIFEEC